jgi:hypothetical protein
MAVRSSVVAALAVALCLLPAARARAGTPPDPCATVTERDAARAIGSPVSAVKPMTIGPSRSCSFHGERPLQGAVVTAFRWDSLAEARARFDDIVKQNARAYDEKPAKLVGAGDEAVSIDAHVYARKGTAAYVFNVFGPRTPALTARAVALAKATMARVR